MAYQLIATHKLYEFEQEEIVEKNLVAGEDGVVTEETKIIQQHAHTWAELKIYQNIIASENRSSFKAELWAYAHAGGEYGDGFIYSPLHTYNDRDAEYTNGYVTGPYGGINMDYYDNGLNRVILNNELYTKESRKESPAEDIRVYRGDTVSQLLAVFDTDYREKGSQSAPFRDEVEKGSSYYQDLMGYHNLDGSFTAITYDRYIGVNDDYRVFPLSFSGICQYCLKDIIINEKAMVKNCGGWYEDLTAEALPIDRGLTPTTAENFTDEENPLIVYTIPTGRSFVSIDSKRNDVITYNAGYVSVEDTVTSLQVALSFDGENIDIPYRDMPIGSTNYVFTLTEAEREILRVKAQGSTNVPIYFMFKTKRHIPYSEFKNENNLLITYIVNEQSAELASKTKRTLTIVGANPSTNPTVKDIKPETLVLTGDENTFIRYESMAEYAINAVASKNAEIVKQSVTCGSKTITDLPQGVIDDVESGNFVFYVEDSRGMAASTTVFKNLVEYVKPTCQQKLEIELSGETGSTIKLTVSGNYFNGSFGAANNSLIIQVRHTQNDGQMGDWVTLTDGLIPVFEGNTYKLETTISGFEHAQAYTFQCRVMDELNLVESSQYTIRLLPVFDWGENDFNFNVPVNIDADELNIHGETIIRHSNTTNNTVLSASGGHIYLRPGGTNSTSGETIIYPNGDIKFGGEVTLADGSVIGGPAKEADYVIETGSEAMGSNGTWYWRKWNSGKAEAWGCRNFGNMAVTTDWGNLYRGAILTQDLPDGVFIRTPDSININIVHSNFGGWICKHEQTAPSAATTGSFIFVRPASATVSPTNIGFHIIGEWK